MESRVILEDLENIINYDLPWEEFKSRTVVVSGAGGFLASYLVKTLLFLNIQRGYKIMVFGLVRNAEKARKVFKDYLKDIHFKLILSDVAKPLKIKCKADYIIHAASKASPKYFAIDPAGVLLPNTIGTFNMLEFARKSKVKFFLFISSSEVYGKGKGKPLSESDFGTLDPTDPRSCYGESKRMGENMCVVWMRQHGVPVKIVRLFHTYGPGMDLTDGRIQADLVSNIVKGRNLVLKSDGRAKRAFCYVTDAVLGIYTVLLKGKAGDSYNVGNEMAVSSISSLAEALCRIFPERKLKIEYQDRKAKDKYLRSRYLDVRPDTKKIKSLGWMPQYSIQEGFKRMVKSYEI